MKKFFSIWKPDMDFVMEDSRKISIALIIASLLGFLVGNVDFVEAAFALVLGFTLWVFAVRKKQKR